MPMPTIGGGDGTTVVNNIISGGSYILGIKNLTDHAGSTMLTYMLKVELTI